MGILANLYEYIKILRKLQKSLDSMGIVGCPMNIVHWDIAFCSLFALLLPFEVGYMKIK